MLAVALFFVLHDPRLICFAVDSHITTALEAIGLLKECIQGGTEEKLAGVTEEVLASLCFTKLVEAI